MTATRPRVVIVGAGFGGLRAAKTLAEADVDVLLLDRHNYHLFQPLLYQVAVAALPPAEIAYPVRSILRRQRNLAFRIAEVAAIDLERKVVRTGSGAFPYDHLILAPGATVHDFGVPGVLQRGFALKGLPDALRLRNHVMRCFEAAIASSDTKERQELLTIIVVGAGPTGVEVAGAVSELLRRVLARDYPAVPRGDVRVVLLESGGRVLPSMPEDLSAAAARSLRGLGVEVRPAAALASYDGDTASLKDGSTVRARTLVWAAGVQSSPLTATLGVACDRLGRVVVEPTLRVPGHPEVWIVGDAARVATPDGAVPMLIPPAIQMGACAARNVVRSLEGRPPQPFRYKDPGTMATIGRSAAVVHLGRVKLWGFPGWVFWLLVHLVQLIGFRNKLVVLVDWAWQYFFYRAASPLILDAPEAAPRRESK